MFYTYFLRSIHFSYANSIDPDQMPHSVASDMGLHYLHMSLLWGNMRVMFKQIKFEENNLTSELLPKRL